MTKSSSLLFGVLFITVFPIYLQATISLPSYGNLTYVTKGSNVSLAWTYDFGSATIGFKNWIFSNTSRSSDFTPLIVLNGDATTIYPKSPFKNIDVVKPATLVLKNVNLDHNGTYRFIINVDRIFPAPTSEILVIIQERPTAVINCSDPTTLNEGDDLTCLCNHTGGNPPPRATWSKDGRELVTGYLKAYLVLKNVRPENAGTYKCTVKSHNLQDDETFKLVVQFKPEIKDFKSIPTPAIVGKKVKITCEADGLPEANYTMYHNGTKLDVVKGVKIIQPVKYKDAGHYRCVASNILGSNSRNLTLQVTAPPITEASTTMTPTNKTSVRPKAGDDEGFDERVIVSIVITALVATLVILVIIYCCCYHRERICPVVCPCCKRNRSSTT